MYKILDKLENPKKNTIPNLLAFSNAYGSLIAKGIREEVPKNLSSPTGLRIFDEIGLHIVEVLSKENLITNQEQKELIKTEPLTRILYPSVYIFNSLRGKGLELANKTFEEWVDKSSKLIR